MALAQGHGIRHMLIEPGRPMQNGYIVSFNGKFGDECLDDHWFPDDAAGLPTFDVPDYVVKGAIAAGEVVTTPDDYRLSIFGTSMYLLYMPDRQQIRAVRTCIDFLLLKARALA